MKAMKNGELKQMHHAECNAFSIGRDSYWNQPLCSVNRNTIARSMNMRTNACGLFNKREKMCLHVLKYLLMKA